MPRILKEITVEVPAERVFEAFASPDVLLICHPGVKSLTQDGSSPQRVGDSFLANYRVMGSQYSQRFRYTRYQSPSEIAFEFVGVTLGTMDFTLTPTASGTQVRLSINYEAPGGLFARAVNRFVFRRRNENDAGRLLTNLKRLVEAPAG
jgi:carbon monoxide dehydrogenase subunit G